MAITFPTSRSLKRTSSLGPLAQRISTEWPAKKKNHSKLVILTRLTTHTWMQVKRAKVGGRVARKTDRSRGTLEWNCFHLAQAPGIDTLAFWSKYLIITHKNVTQKAKHTTIYYLPLQSQDRTQKMLPIGSLIALWERQRLHFFDLLSTRF